MLCDELNDCDWNLGLYKRSDKYVYVDCVESFSHIECYSDGLRRGSHLLILFATVLFNVYSVFTVEWLFLTRPTPHHILRHKYHN